MPEQKPFVLDLIQSVDRLLAADAALRKAVAEHIGPASALAFDRSAVADHVGVFSRNITVLTETVQGDRAIVTIQVADRLPLDKVHLVRRNGCWLIQTDPPIVAVAKEVRELADVLSDVARTRLDHPVPAAELRAEIEARQQAIARRLAAATGPHQP